MPLSPKDRAHVLSYAPALWRERAAVVGRIAAIDAEISAFDGSIQVRVLEELAKRGPLKPIEVAAALADVAPMSRFDARRVLRVMKGAGLLIQRNGKYRLDEPTEISIRPTPA